MSEDMPREIYTLKSNKESGTWVSRPIWKNDTVISRYVHEDREKELLEAVKMLHEAMQHEIRHKGDHVDQALQKTHHLVEEGNKNKAS